MNRHLLILFLSLLCTEFAFASCTNENVRDTFSSLSYSLNNGSQNWVGNWQEIGESDGVSAGQARVSNSNCSSGYCLRIGTPTSSGPQYTNRGARREVNLSNASSATLTFNYFTGFGNGTANVSLEVSNDGGTNWTQLRNYTINSTSFTATPQSFDLTPYIATNTQIRFIGSGSRGSRTGMYIDDIDIAYDQCLSPTAITDVSQLDFEGNFVYAVNFNGSGAQRIQDATFTNVDQRGNGAPSGVSISRFNQAAFWNGASNLGTSADNNTLENVMRSLIWASSLNNGQIDLDVEVGTTYRLQLLFSEGCCNNRHFDVDIETSLVNDEIIGTSVGGTVWRSSSTQGYAIIKEFTATDPILNINFSRHPPGDTNYHISGFTLENTQQTEELIASYTFNDTWSSSSPLEDSTGSANGTVSGAVSRVASPASGIKPETCTAGNFNGGAIDIYGLPVSTTTGEKTSISFWMNWNGTNSVMPLGWRYHDLWMYGGSFGFNTASGDIYGISSAGLANSWQHVTVVFTNGSVADNKIYINGVEQRLTQRRRSPNNRRAVVDPHLRIGGWWGNNGYRFRGQLDEVKIYKGEITQATIDANRTQTSPCSSPIEYRFDEASWSNPNDVIDSSNRNYHGTAFNTQPVEGLVCNAADLSANATNDYISLNRAALNNASDFSISVWAKTSNTRSQSIVSGSSGRQHNELIMWFPNSSRFTPFLKGRNAGSIAITNIADNQWHHLVWTRSGAENCLYVDGIRSTCLNLSNQPVSIANGGLIIGQEQDSLGGRFDINQDFEGLLDELMIFDYPLSATEVGDIRTNHLAGNGWDGQPRTCPTPNLDHFEISYAKAGVTCLPTSVTIKACADATCSSVISDDVDITLAPASGWPSNPITISNGQATLNLNHPTAGNLPLDITASSITPTNAIRCLANNIADPSCSIDVAETGFVFDVPKLTACKPSANVTIRAVKQGTGPSQCVSALTGNKTLSFWSDYDIPASGTTPVQVNGTAVATSNTGTAINLTFNAQGEAQFTAQYDDAGRLNLNAKYDDGAGLVMTGSDSFVSTPVTLVSYSDDSGASCASQDASCSVFKKAGQNFNLKVKAACWTHDADTDFTDNPETPNFELASIGITHSVIAPGAGVSGQIATNSFNFSTSNQGTHTVQQTVSEVGVFEFDLILPAYLGETLTSTPSNAIGRFIPDYFTATTTSNGSFGNNACTGFSYSGQTFTYQTRPQLTITAYNTDDEVTQNYRGDFAKLQDTDFTVTSPSSDAVQLGSDNATLVALDWQPAAMSLNDNNNGTLTFEFGNDQYTYRHEANSRIAPFTNAVDLTFTSISDSDNITTTGLPHTLQPSGEPIRFGRIAIDSTHGSELVPLTTAVRAEYFNGFSWIENTADACTVINLTNHIGLRNPDTSGGALQSGNTTMTIGTGSTTATLTNANPLSSGSASLTLSAPGQDNQGYVDVSSRIGASYPWLLGDYDNSGSYNNEAQGRVSFGLFRGSNNIIFRRERF